MSKVTADLERVSLKIDVLLVALLVALLHALLTPLVLQRGCWSGDISR